MNGKVTRAIFERRAASGERRSREITLPPTLLAARGSRLEYRTGFLAAPHRTRFLAAPPARILEQKRDCSQSTVNALRQLTLAFAANLCGSSVAILLR